MEPIAVEFVHVVYPDWPLLTTIAGLILTVMSRWLAREYSRPIAVPREQTPRPAPSADGEVVLAMTNLDSEPDEHALGVGRFYLRAAQLGVVVTVFGCAWMWL